MQPLARLGRPAVLVATFLANVLGGFPSPAALRLLRDLGVRYAVLHPGLLPPASAALCTEAEARAAPHLALRYSDAEACVVEVLGAPPPETRPLERRLPLADVRLTASSGDAPWAAADGDPRTRWRQVRRRAGSIDLPEPHALTRIVLHLGRHFGDYLRVYQLFASDDGKGWTPLGDPQLGEAPLRSLVADPEDLAMEIAVPARPVRYLRLVRPVIAPGLPWNLWASWPTWGVNEIELYELAP